MDIPQAGFLTPAEFDPAVAFIFTLHHYDGDEADIQMSPVDRRLIFWPAVVGHEEVADRGSVLRAMVGANFREATRVPAYGDG
jgi:hypothetical protein